MLRDLESILEDQGILMICLYVFQLVCYLIDFTQGENYRNNHICQFKVSFSLIFSLSSSGVNSNSLIECYLT